MTSWTGNLKGLYAYGNRPSAYLIHDRDIEQHKAGSQCWMMLNTSGRRDAQGEGQFGRWRKSIYKQKKATKFHQATKRCSWTKNRKNIAVCKSMRRSLPPGAFLRRDQSCRICPLLADWDVHWVSPARLWRQTGVHPSGSMQGDSLAVPRHGHDEHGQYGRCTIPVSAGTGYEASAAPLKCLNGFVVDYDLDYAAGDWCSSYIVKT